jgi:hypothetical protein
MNPFQIGFLFIAATLTLGTASTPAQVPAVATRTEAPPAVFLGNVDAYIRLHRRVEIGLPRRVVTEDLETLLAPKRAMALAMSKARATARQGDLFTLEVAEYFRATIARALREGGIDDFLAIVEEENDVHVVPTVNGDYPAGASQSFMPPCLLAALPPLPEELEYRFLGRDLVLVDRHAGLIVDFVPRAIPETT